jgi:hypothetical protein
MMEQDIRDVQEGRVQRVCVPGRYVVWREGESVRVELKECH